MVALEETKTLSTRKARSTSFLLLCAEQEPDLGSSSVQRHNYVEFYFVTSPFNPQNPYPNPLFLLFIVQLIKTTSQVHGAKPKQRGQLILVLLTCALAHCRSEFLSIVLVRFPVLLWMAPCFPGRAPVHSFTMSKDNDQHTVHTRYHQHSEMQPISGRICSSIIACNNTALGTNCFTTLRPALKVADEAFSAKSRKYHGGEKGEKGEQIRNLPNQRQLS